MCSIGNKRRGSIRVAVCKQRWYDFTLSSGCAYGVDESGHIFASFGVPAKQYGLPDARPGHIIVFRCNDTESIGDPVYHGDAYGEKIPLSPRPALLMKAGRYGTPWAMRWRPTQVDAMSAFGKAIRHAISDYGAKQYIARQNRTQK